MPVLAANLLILAHGGQNIDIPPPQWIRIYAAAALPR